MIVGGGGGAPRYDVFGNVVASRKGTAYEQAYGGGLGAPSTSYAGVVPGNNIVFPGITT